MNYVIGYTMRGEIDLLQINSGIEVKDTFTLPNKAIILH